MQHATCNKQKHDGAPRWGERRRTFHPVASQPLLRVWHLAFCILHFASAASAQQLLDRVVARVSGNALTLTELQSARGFGIINAPTEAAALPQLIDRQLLLIEVGRFPPPEPTEAAV